jgi:hypothetical protein
MHDWMRSLTQPKENDMKLNWMVDPGHAWLVVELSELDALGIRDKISSYSYKKDNLAYLEEDCDAAIYIEAVIEQRGISPTDMKPHTINFNDNAPCRSYSRF